MRSFSHLPVPIIAKHHSNLKLHKVHKKAPCKISQSVGCCQNRNETPLLAKQDEESNDENKMLTWSLCLYVLYLWLCLKWCLSPSPSILVPVCACVPVCASACASACTCACVSVPVCLSVPLPAPVPVCLCLCLYTCVPVSAPASASASACTCFCLSACTPVWSLGSVSICTWVWSLCLSVCLSVCLYLCLCLCMKYEVCVCACVCLSVCLSVSLCTLSSYGQCTLYLPAFDIPVLEVPPSLEGQTAVGQQSTCMKNVQGNLFSARTHIR